MKTSFSEIRQYLLIPVIMLCMTVVGAMPVSAQDNLEQTLAKVGIIKADCKDWSDSTKITIPKPICAYVNLIGVTTVPTSPTVTRNIWMEVYDGFGNYFKKRVQMGVQGRSSGRWPKRNFKANFFNDEWVGDDTPDIKIGNWVDQDGFHFKAFYLDYFKGTGIIGYKIYDQITSDRGEYGRVWERTTNIKKPDLEALCHPDGFPCAVFFNGKFYGLYCWQLKKHRKNMSMKKHTPEHVYVDGTLVDNTTLFGGTIVWKRLEIRNPKDLYTMSGNLYDRDAPEELMDETSPYYDLDSDSEEVREYKQNTAKVKGYVKQLSNYGNEIQALINKKVGRDSIRAAIAERFDVPTLVDYIIHNVFTNNFDGLLKNYQWFTYDGKKWFVTPYDLDATMGYFPINYIIFPAQFYNIYPMSMWNFNLYPPIKWVYLYFKNEIDERYAHIRDTGLLNAETIASMFSNWYYAVGEDNYKNEWLKWKASPCLLETIPNSQWTLTSYNYSKYKSTADYSDTVTYTAGQYCRAEYRLWKANTTVKGVKPYKQVGCKDSLERIYPWTLQRLVAVDTWMNYSFTSLPVTYTLTISSVGWSTLCIPFKFAIPEGIELYTVTGCKADGTLIKKRVTDPEAYTPYLVKGHPGDYALIGQSEEANEGAADYMVNGCMHGCLVERYVPQGGYVLQNHNGKAAFYHVAENGKVKMGANRAYFVFDGDMATYPILFDEGSPSSVSVTEQSSEIVGIYGLDGTEKQHLEKGINIIKYSNGKTIKMVVK